MKLISLAVTALLAIAATAQYEYDYSYGYDFYDNDFGGYGDEGYGGDSGGFDDSGSSAAGGYSSYYDEYGYYGDEDESYYEYYGYYADDFAGYEDYYAEEYDFYEECFFDANGAPVLVNGTASCNIKVSGANKQADKLTGGLDGVYKLASCYNGKPMYRRKDSPAGQDRVLWYSSTFGDWDISKGTDPNEAEILMYGGEMEHASVPLFVSSWHLGGDLRSGGVEDEYSPVNVKVVCSDGTVYKEDEVRTTPDKVGPVLTDKEMDAKYRYIYDKYMQDPEPSPTINFTFVVLLVMTGLTIVLAIPYFLLRKKGAAGKAGGGSISSNFASMIQQSRKKQTGHVN